MRRNLLKKLVMIFFVLILSLTIFNDDVNAGWSQMPSGTITDAYLYGVWGSSPTDVFAVGYNDSTWNSVILHYDGSNWSQMDSLERAFLNGVWGSSGTDVFAVGYCDSWDCDSSDLILHYDGSTWSIMDSGGSWQDWKELYSIWGSSATDVFAVGVYYDDNVDEISTILHYDGSTWSEMDSGTLSYTTLYGVWGSSPTDVFAVGTYAYFVEDEDYYIWKSVILHYDGSTWSEMDSGVQDNTDFLGVWGSSPTDVFAVGYGGGSTGLLAGCAIFHYDGSTWSPMTGGTLGDIDLYGVWGSSGTDVFAVGFNYNDSSSVILHYDGSTWSEMDSGTLSDTALYGVWGSSSILGLDAFAVGIYYEETTKTYNSIILHYESCPTEEIYGEHSKETELLRKFRDSVLSKTPEGKELIRLYYEWSPAIVKAMKEDGTFKNQVKEMIDGILPLIK